MFFEELLVVVRGTRGQLEGVGVEFAVVVELREDAPFFVLFAK